MARFVALLRGINVGGRGLVPMADLQAFFESLGCHNVQTVIQSANVLFTTKHAHSSQLETLLEQQALKQFGGQIGFFLRTAVEWNALLAGNPFPAEAAEDPGHLLVMSLKAKPEPADVETLRKAIVGREYLEARGREHYLVYPDGIGRSKFTGALIEKKLGIRGTARNWNTLQKINNLL